jgi:hypothetical protein
MCDASVYIFIRVAGTFCAELEDAPVVFVAAVDEGDEAWKGIAVGAGGECDGRTGCDDD